MANGKVGAPKGNKNAEGHGRPPEYDIEAEANLLLEWSKKEDSIHLGQFVLERDFSPEYISRWSIQNDYFRQTLKRVKLNIAIKLRTKLHDQNNPYNYGLFNREIGMYDCFLNEFERGEKAYEASLKKESEEKPTQVIFEVNYGKDSNDKVEILPKNISNKNTKSLK